MSRLRPTMPWFRLVPTSFAIGNVMSTVISTDNAIVRFDGITGTIIQNSSVIIADNGDISGVNVLNSVSAQISGLTASEILGTDASKNLVSLAVATYPSLAELVYVKGVTSAIQTQLNGKQATGSYALTTSSLAHFAATTSLELLGVISDETGSGSLVFATSPTLVTPLLGTPTSGVLTNCTGLPLTGLVSDTTTALGIGSINLGHATDTTIARVSAGVVSIEGNNIYTAGGTDVAVADGGTGLSTIAALSLLVANSLDTFVALTPGAGNSIRINAGGTAWEAYTPGGGGASTALDNLASVNINAALNSTSANLEIKTTTTGLLLLNPAERNVIVGSATTGFSTIAATRAGLTLAGTTSGAVFEFGLKTATNGEAILRLTGYNGTTAVSSIQSDSNAATNNTGHWNFFVNNGAGLISGIKIESDGGVFLANLLAAAASTDVNINGSNELHSVTSSKRFKENITNIKQDTSGIYDLKVREYDFKEKFGGQHEVGIIAEEAINVLPQLVVLDKDNKPYSFQYSRLSVFLLAEIQKLQKRIKTLELSSN